MQLAVMADRENKWPPKNSFSFAGLPQNDRVAKKELGQLLSSSFLYVYRKVSSNSIIQPMQGHFFDHSSIFLRIDWGIYL